MPIFLILGLFFFFGMLVEYKKENLRINFGFIIHLLSKERMGILVTFIIAFFLGYLYGYKIKPKSKFREALKEVKEQCRAVLEEGNKGVYKTIVMDNNQSSELVVEVKELAVTERGQVKVQYLSAYYSNPSFRNKKGDALLNEVRDLLGEYLPLNEIEWFETNHRHDNVRNFVDSLHNTYKKQFRA